MRFYFFDTINFISKLSFPRFWNFIKVYFSFQITKLIKTPIQWGTPFTISFEPTTACNLKCPECPSGLR